MNQANGKIERAFNVQKRKAISIIGELQTNLQTLDDTAIQQKFYDTITILQPQMDMPWIPKKFWKLYIFMLYAIDPYDYLNTLKRKTNFHRNDQTIQKILKQLKTNLLQTKGEKLNGLFGGVVHKSDINPEIYETYFPRAAITIYTDMVCYMTNGKYLDLENRDERIKDKFALMNTINFRSRTFYTKLKTQQDRYNSIKNIDWQPIWDKCDTWKPLPYDQYLNTWQLSVIPKDKLK